MIVCGEAGVREKSEAEQDVADLRDAGISKHALQIVLEDSDKRGGEHGEDRERQDNHFERRCLEFVVEAEDGEHEAEHHVDRDFRRRCSEEGRDCRRREAVGIRQPQMQREHGELQADTDEDEDEAHMYGAAVAMGSNPHRQVGHVERARDHVEHANADHEERRTDGSHDQVVVGRGERTLVPPCSGRNQRIGGKRRYLQKHEDVEGVARDRDAEKARQAEQKSRVKEALPLGRYFRGNAASCVWQDDCRHAGDNHQHKGVQHIDAIFDADRRRPAAHLVGDDRATKGLRKKREGNKEGEPRNGRSESP